MIFSKDYSHLLLVPEGKEGAAHIPDQTNFVPALGISRCPGLLTVEVGEGGAAFSSYNGMLFTKDMKTLVAAPAGIGASAVLPEGVEAIGEHALAGCKNLASVTALGSVREIAPTAFTDETKATAVVALPAGEDYETRKSVWEQATFQHFAEPAKPGATTRPSADSSAGSDSSSGSNQESTSGLTYTLLDDYTLEVFWQGKDDPESSLEIPTSAELSGVSYRVSAIAPNAFSNRASLTSVKLPVSVTSIGEGAFAGCANLTSIELPDALRDIGVRAFEATALTGVWLPASVTSVGSRTFAACGSLTRVVAQGTPAVAEDALASCAGVSVYCPYNAEGSYPWIVGLPSAGNHLLPYGVELAADPLALEAGQEANLLEGGLLEVPEPVETLYSYAASPLSVDAGTVSAKKTGTTDVTAVLSLDGEELARSSRSVEVSPGAEDESDEEKVPVTNETVPLIPGTYLSTLASPQLSVTAPVRVTFGDANGYDVANPAPSVTSKGYFQNNSSSLVRMTGLTCTGNGIETVLDKTSTSELAAQRLFSLYPTALGEGKALHFGYGPNVNTATPGDKAVFEIKTDDKLDCTYRLNLTANNCTAKVRESVADNGVSVQSLANVTYTFELITPELENFYLEDKKTGKAFSLAEVKAHANDIAANGTNSTYYSRYDGYIQDDSTYTCQTKWGGTVYDVRIIGIYHDELASGPGKAGLTFQFKNLLNTTYQMNSMSDNSGGWGKSPLKINMNGGAIWKSVPADLQKQIVTVKKYYAPNYKDETSAVSISEDKLFLASYYEHTGAMYIGWYGSSWVTKEGQQYEYWSNQVTQEFYSDQTLVKGYQSDPEKGVSWWERSVYPKASRTFLGLSSTGSHIDGLSSEEFAGVCPCFCL